MATFFFVQSSGRRMTRHWPVFYGGYPVDETIQREVERIPDEWKVIVDILLERFTHFPYASWSFITTRMEALDDGCLVACLAEQPSAVKGGKTSLSQWIFPNPNRSPGHSDNRTVAEKEQYFYELVLRLRLGEASSRAITDSPQGFAEADRRIRGNEQFIDQTLRDFFAPRQFIVFFELPDGSLSPLMYTVGVFHPITALENIQNLIRDLLDTMNDE